MSIEIEEKNGKIYIDDPWPENHDAIRLMLDERDVWKNADVTILCDNAILSYCDRLPLNGKTVKASKYLNGVVYVLAPYGSKIKTIWKKTNKTKEHIFEVGPQPLLSCCDFRDGYPLYFEKEKNNPGCGDELTIAEIFSTYRNHAAYIRGLELINENDVILDLGAHIGTFARDAIAKKPKGIICVEALKRNYDILEKNLEVVANKSTKINTIFGAVTSDNSDATIRLWVDVKNQSEFSSKYRYAISSIIHKKYKVPIAVKSYGFRKLLNRFKPTILKIDTEGAECHWDFSNLPSQVRAIIIEAEVLVNVIDTNGNKLNWYHDVFLHNMKDAGFQKIVFKKDWGYTRDELWVK